jgi:hypothetical protein
MVVSQIRSLFASVIGAQLPHQLLKVPFSSGLVNPEMPFISTRKVTLNASNENPWIRNPATKNSFFIDLI